jgi:hypothetical protein
MSVHAHKVSVPAHKSTKIFAYICTIPCANLSTFDVSQEVLKISGDAWRQLSESERRSFTTEYKDKENSVNNSAKPVTKQVNGKHSAVTEVQAHADISNNPPEIAKEIPKEIQKESQKQASFGPEGLQQPGRDADKDKVRLKKVHLCLHHVCVCVYLLH